MNRCVLCNDSVIYSTIDNLVPHTHTHTHTHTPSIQIVNYNLICNCTSQICTYLKCGFSFHNYHTNHGVFIP